MSLGTDFRKTRAKWKLFVAQLSLFELVQVADDIIETLDYRAKTLEKDKVERDAVLDAIEENLRGIERELERGME